MNRPAWCPHSDCSFLCQTQDAACVGRLPAPDPHDGDVNTHRLCLRGAQDDGGWTFDLKLNRSDAYHLKRMLDVLMKDSPLAGPALDNDPSAGSPA
jgi:hypothetical protein